MLAVPDEFVVTIRLESDPALVVKKIVPPAALPPDCPGFSVTDKFNVLPAAPFCPLPVVVRVAGGFPTTIHPLCVCEMPFESVLGTVYW